MTLRIYNTLTRALEEFSPLEAGHVRMYVCGITVYDFCHVGHARAMIAFDVVQRWLKARGWRVTYVRNITDIDDKIIRRAVENGETLKALTSRMIAAMYEDTDALGVERPTHDPRATDYIPQMLSMIETLERKGLAYRSADGDVNYAVRKFAGYGKLSGKSLDELHAGNRVAVAEGKEDPLDPVLWKRAKPAEPAEAKWESPFGTGRPGWHIECSAMACDLLGETFDIHGGGADLQFPHHENEIAQSEGATGKPFAMTWMHNGFINIDNEKMSKSLGNFFTIRDVLRKYDAETLRFFIVRAHYRSDLNYSDVHLDDARNALKRLYRSLADADALLGEQGLMADCVPLSDLPDPFDWVRLFKKAMDEDFGTPQAVAVLFHIAGDIQALRNSLIHNKNPDIRDFELQRLRDSAMALRSLGGALGLLTSDPVRYLRAGASLDEATIQARIGERAAAKAAKNFAEADRIRNDLLAQGIVLKDGPAGTTWAAAQ
ncbi:cysteine--tRNA ligase [Pseudacidovorax intermedius]|uniref:Cysteine--tRNA ligase n=1 Tax=Pseudacidovorax intermedius TaxID=433924 RepID=A0A147H991_9BURK|nr:cysteine--tRNA ligase [Pseudacidovorax intermedius]KTT26526.1 cysteinyl-tRNA synthetase [Pseudacidovorax intermedius]